MVIKLPFSYTNNGKTSINLSPIRINIKKVLSSALLFSIISSIALTTSLLPAGLAQESDTGESASPSENTSQFDEE
jgi:hypothetical protein